jgi:hypothetical protein
VRCTGDGGVIHKAFLQLFGGVLPFQTVCSMQRGVCWGGMCWGCRSGVVSSVASAAEGGSIGHGSDAPKKLTRLLRLLGVAFG